MLSSYELIGFISPELAHRILADTAQDNRELYEATHGAVARLPKIADSEAEAPLLVRGRALEKSLAKLLADG